MNLADIIAQRDAGTLPAATTETITAAELTRLEQETGIPAAVWQQTYEVAESRKVFDAALNAWREHFVGAVDPRVIAADLRWALNLKED